MPSRTILIATSIFSLLSSALAQNTFTYPMPGVAQNFTSGDTVNVSWNTTFAHPFLQLYCGGIDHPIANFSLAPSATAHPIHLDIASQSHCYLHMQDGTGFSPALPSFGTGIFAINPSNGTVGTFGLQGHGGIPGNIGYGAGLYENCFCRCTA